MVNRTGAIDGSDDLNKVGVLLSVGVPGGSVYRHSDGSTAAGMGSARLSVVTAPPDFFGLDAGDLKPVVITIHGDDGEIYLEMSPWVAEALGRALLRHAAQGDESDAPIL